ncbi:MAG: methyltransferase domain-containing protein [Candidatus Brocadiaceae bacterium]|nr:methyltransferase domain-containing protein [Candidatus Brocadiaceae bacterium]
MKPGKFDIDSEALAQRIDAHVRYGLYDINEWILQQMEIHAGLSILELGCGTGKQTLPLARMVGTEGTVVAVDIAETALRALQRRAQELRVDGQIRLWALSLDDLRCVPCKELFDRALASYSLYYARDPYAVIQTVQDVLRPSGLFFFCGPGRGNNAELLRFICSLRGTELEDDPVHVLMEDKAPQMAGAYFRHVEISTFVNPLRFDSVDSLLRYWRSHNLYEEQLERDFAGAAEAHFQRHRSFETVKRVIGVKATK